MGRYYNGDIEGKFWFGIQSSTSADRFGVKHSEPNYVNYYFDKEDLEGVQSQLALIKKRLGINLEMLENFFKDPVGYTYDQLSSYLKLSKEESQEMLKEYADYILGRKIEACIIEQGSCDFDAEL